MRKFLATGFVFALLFSWLALSQPVLSVAQVSEDELKRQLAEIEKQIKEQEKELSEISGEKQTLVNKLNALKKEQNLLQNQIRATSNRVKQIDGQLSVTEMTISETEQKLDEAKIRLGETVRELHILDRRSFLEVIMGTDSLSDALTEIENLNVLITSLDNLADEMREIKSSLDQQVVQLEEQQVQARHLLAIAALQESQYEAKVNEQNQLVAITAGVEAEYQRILAESRQKAAEIRNRIFDLEGLTTQVTFGEAVEIAKWVESHTGVRAALLLAILKQESNLGANVGRCNIVDTTSGSSRHVSTGRIYQRGIHPTRDLPKLLIIAEELGMDPLQTPISCTLVRGGREIGYGGAMGPAQFIPSTWMGYRERVSAIVGTAANPWDIRHAFLASGTLLAGNGAAGGDYQAEWRAAMRYFAGGNWNNPAYRFYGDNVMALANKFQAEIDALAGN